MSSVEIAWGSRTILLRDGAETLEVTVTPPNNGLLRYCQEAQESLVGYFPDRTVALGNYVAYNLPGARVVAVEMTEQEPPPPDAVP